LRGRDCHFSSFISETTERISTKLVKFLFNGEEGIFIVEYAQVSKGFNVCAYRSIIGHILHESQN